MCSFFPRRSKRQGPEGSGSIHTSFRRESDTNGDRRRRAVLHPILYCFPGDSRPALHVPPQKRSWEEMFHGMNVKNPSLLSSVSLMCRHITVNSTPIRGISAHEKCMKHMWCEKCSWCEQKEREKRKRTGRLRKRYSEQGFQCRSRNKRAAGDDEKKK